MNPLNRKPATLRRALATIIDYGIITCFSFWFITTYGQPNGEGGKTVSGLPAFIPLAFWFSWLVLTETYFGATLGHELMKLKVVTITGDKITFGQALKRRLCDALEISWCFGFVAFLLVRNNENRQRLGDILAKTIVVDKYEDLTSLDFDFEKPSQPQ